MLKKLLIQNAWNYLKYFYTSTKHYYQNTTVSFFQNIPISRRINFKLFNIQHRLTTNKNIRFHSPLFREISQ